MNVCQQMNAHPRISRVAISKLDMALYYDLSDGEAVLRAVVSHDDWPQDALAFLRVTDDELQDVDGLTSRLLTETDGWAR